MITTQFSDKVKGDLLELIGEDKRQVGNIFSNGQDKYLVRYNRMEIVPELKPDYSIIIKVNYYYNQEFIGSYICDTPLSLGQSLVITENEGIHSITISPT